MSTDTGLGSWYGWESSTGTNPPDTTVTDDTMNMIISDLVASGVVTDTEVPVTGGSIIGTSIAMPDWMKQQEQENLEYLRQTHPEMFDKYGNLIPPKPSTPIAPNSVPTPTTSTPTTLDIAKKYWWAILIIVAVVVYFVFFRKKRRRR